MELFRKLFKPGWMTEDRGRALASLQKITDEEALMEIALHAPLKAVRQSALNRIHRKDLLSRLADGPDVPADVSIHARESYVKTLSYPSYKDYLIDKILKNTELGESAASARMIAARMLPEGHQLLDQPCCPQCGCVGSVRDYSKYKYVPVGYDGFRCAACSRKVEAKHAHVSLYGLPAPKDFSVPLREFVRQGPQK